MPDEKNLYQKLAEISDSIGLIEKGGTAPKEIGGYKFIEHAQVMAHVRGELFRHNIVIFPSMQLISNELIQRDGKAPQRYSIVKTTWTIVNGDDPKETITLDWIGEGLDTQDKGIQKAGTSSEKYFLMKLFKVSDKDDPDAIVVKDQVESQATGNKTPEKAPEKPAEPVKAAEPAPAPVESPAPSAPLTTDEAALRQRQIAALVWLGGQLPPKAGWFQGKIVPLVSLYENKAKANRLSAEEKEAGNGINWVFNQIAASHKENCGDGCAHLTAAEAAIIFGAEITETA